MTCNEIIVLFASHSGNQMLDELWVTHAERSLIASQMVEPTTGGDVIPTMKGITFIEAVLAMPEPRMVWTMPEGKKS